jgi:hypothetical protein
MCTNLIHEDEEETRTGNEMTAVTKKQCTTEEMI